MVLIWGRKGHSEVIGYTRERIECSSCSNVGPWSIVGFGKRATVYFIPTVKYGMEYGAMCQVCTAGVSLGKGSVGKQKAFDLANGGEIRQALPHN
jgi:hypothetical protein